MFALCVITERVVDSDIPQIIQDKSTEQLTAMEGSDLTLECAAQGFPVPQINWEKYGGQLPVGRYSIVLGPYEATDAIIISRSLDVLYFIYVVIVNLFNASCSKLLLFEGSSAVLV